MGRNTDLLNRRIFEFRVPLSLQRQADFLIKLCINIVVKSSGIFNLENIKEGHFAFKPFSLFFHYTFYDSACGNSKIKNCICCWGELVYL